MVPFLLKKSATPPIYEKIQRKKHDNINGLVGLQVILIKKIFYLNLLRSSLYGENQGFFVKFNLSKMTSPILKP